MAALTGTGLEDLLSAPHQPGVGSHLSLLLQFYPCSFQHPLPHVMYLQQQELRTGETYAGWLLAG
jgi:hypothetical protein